MKQISIQQLNKNILGVKSGLEDKIDNVKHGLEDKIDSVKHGLEDKIDNVKHGLEDKIDDTKSSMEYAIEDLALYTKQSFDKFEERFKKIETLVYLNADSIARLTQKTNIEFATATVQRQRLLDKIDNHEYRFERLESHPTLA